MPKKPIMLIGVGQCGGNIADVAEAKGFSSIALNSDEGDLDSLKNVSNRIHFKGYSGAGKNRSAGQEALRDNLDEVIEKVMVAADDPEIKVISVAFSTDGGTGSGSGPLLINVLSQVTNKVITAIPVLPKLEDSLGSLANSSECISDLSRIENLGACFFIDNHKVSQKARTKKELFYYTNKTMIELLENIYNATGQRSTEGNFDKADMLSILATRGAAVITDILCHPNAEILNQSIKDGWDKNSLFTTPEFDQRIVNAGLIYRTTEEIAKKVDLKNVFAQVGMPIEVFSGHYTALSGQTITTILSGLTFPITRMQEMDSIAESNKRRIEENVLSSINQKYDSKASWVNDLRNSKKNKADDIPLSEKLKKFRS